MPGSCGPSTNAWTPRPSKPCDRVTPSAATATRARFGFTAAPGTTDDARVRDLTIALPPRYAARLFDAPETGANEQRLRDIAAEGLGEMYFRDGGRRAHGLGVEITDVEHIAFDL